MLLVDYNGWLASNHATHKITKSSPREFFFRCNFRNICSLFDSTALQGVLVTIDTRIKHARRWEIWDEFGNIATVVAKAFLSGPKSGSPSVPEEKFTGAPAIPFFQRSTWNNGLNLAEQSLRMHIERSFLWDCCLVKLSISMNSYVQSDPSRRRHS